MTHAYQLRFPLLLLLSIVLIHLIEVNFIDPLTTTIMEPGFTSLLISIEQDFVAGFSELWMPATILFFVFIYIILYPFTLWYTPLYSLITNHKKALETLAFSLLFVYLFALPFYLFFPVTNVYTSFDLPSALNIAIPKIEIFFYTTTTQNNCFPSLHTAMSIIITRTIFTTENKRFQFLSLFVMVTVIISVLYLSIHWILDVIGGIIVALLSLYLTEKTINWMNHHESI
ncbi:MAG: inositol phosphorylceramide synthase [Candidatus Thermoplasmatota archaeon]|nr:inositol phosphorylceramide synthase [Candidatus Thermoplasmatota archaeon]